MADVPLHISVLQHLLRRTDERREKLKEQMANGLPATEYERTVGRARECKTLIDDIEETLVRLRKGEIDEEDDEQSAEIERTRHKPRRPRAR